MSPDRRQQVSQIFHAALARDARERAEFLEAACGGDEALRREVESLLGYQGAEGFLTVTPEGRVKVLDFGLAKRLSGGELAEVITSSHASLTQPGAILGTLPYMAPEQLLIELGKASWSLYDKIPPVSDSKKKSGGGTGRNRREIREDEFGHRTTEMFLTAVKRDIISESQASGHFRAGQSSRRQRASQAVPDSTGAPFGRAVQSRVGGRGVSDYHINIFYSDEDAAYVADIPDLDACSAFGATAEAALAAVELAKDAWLHAARESGRPVPMPRYRPAIYQTVK